MLSDPLILASASPRRHELLRELGVAFEVRASPLPEPARLAPAVSPRGWAEALAYFKARSVSRSWAGRWVLGADTIVACGPHVLGKPVDERDALRMLELQTGTPSDVITGVALVREDETVTRCVSSAVTRVWMRDDKEAREAYLRSGDWRGKAGAYGIQDVGDVLVERIEGSRSNVVGLPLELLGRMLKIVVGAR